MALDREGLWQRITEAFQTQEVSEIATRLGLSYHAVYRWKRGEGVPDLGTFASIADLSSTSIHWLITGSHGPKQGMIREEPSVYLGEAERDIISKLARQENRSFQEETRQLVLESLVQRGLVADKVDGTSLIFFGDHAPRLKLVRLLGEIAAGRPIQVFDQSEQVFVAEEFLMPGRESFVLKVRGDSMKDDNIVDGDLIICYESKVATNGQTVVVLIDGDQATVKRFYKEGARVRLQPANDEVKPIILPADRVIIQGIVVGIQRKP